jgi:transcriptional regulator with XRE-family HTH domain
MELPFTAEVFRAARAGVDKSQPEIAKLAGLGLQTVVRAERGTGVPPLRIDTLQKIVGALATAGAVIDADGRVSFRRAA